MAPQAGHDEDINRLNETFHYAGTADFKGLDCMMNLEQYLLVQTLPPPDAIVPYLAEARFGDTMSFRDFTFDNSLVLTLVERWRSETHTFHLPRGEVVQHGDMCHSGVAPWCQASSGDTAGGAEEGVVHDIDDFAECKVLSWGSAVLAWTYQSLCLAAQRGITGIADCTPLLMSWIYQRFPLWCPPNRGVYQYPLAARLVGLQQHCRDQHQASVLYYMVSIDRLRFDEFNGEQPVPGIPVNLDRYLTTTGRGEDVWWPERLQQWYDGWRQRFEPGRRIIVHYTFDTRPTSEYYDWGRGACRVRHLSGQEVLEDPRLVELSPDVQPTASQSRDDLTLPRGMPDRRRRVWQVREDTL
ncbi:uncharacterized protein DS421_3g89720 [Arachis hypogaea]|nr:uncharacterized protein DS421_3g89720 [Arachis hypogaea]